MQVFTAHVMCANKQLLYYRMANTCTPMVQVGLSERNTIYIIVGDEEGCTDYVQLGAEDLNQKQVKHSTVLTMQVLYSAHNVFTDVVSILKQNSISHL